MSEPKHIPTRIEGDPSCIALDCDGHILQVISARAFPPGKPLLLALLLTPELALEARSIGSKKRDDARFDLRMRLINMTRETKERLALTFGY